MTGFHQVPPILTPAQGRFRARLGAGGQSLEYELSYSGLTTPAMFAHIHFGHRTDNGEIMFFLCGGGGKPDCAGTAGTVTGTITPADVMAIPEQGLESGDFAGMLEILREGLGYVNVHTPTFPDGEIRGQVL